MIIEWRTNIMITQQLKDNLQNNVSNLELDFKFLHYNLVPHFRAADAIKDIIQLEKTLKQLKMNIKEVTK